MIKFVMDLYADEGDGDDEEPVYYVEERAAPPTRAQYYVDYEKNINWM